MGDGMEGVGGDGYSFASEPRAVSSRKKARDLQSPGGPSPGQGGEERLAINIMWDRRVVRGSTRPGTQGSQQPEPMQSPAPSGRNSSAMQRGPQLSRSRDRSRRSQRGAPGRHEAPVWVPAEPLPESMYEEILDRPIDIYEASTDKGNSDRPPSPIFIPQAQGVDAGTQVEDDDLFDFDTEVEPIIERVVGSTLQQALMECDEEDM
ncbi:radial spoke protein 3-domain-containing protein, partial [Baffinella frigidus]